MKRRARERGAMLVIMAGVLLLFAVLALGALTILRIIVARQEVQRVADAACLAATTIIKHDGLPLDQKKQDAAAAMAFRNHPGLDFGLKMNQTETDTSVDVQCQASIDVNAPLIIWKSGHLTVTATAAASVGQVTETQATRLYPKLMLVLDYSGSMLNHLGGKSSQPESITKLRQAVNALLATPASFKYGLVIFATGVLASLPPALGSNQAIKKLVNSDPHGCPDNGNCLTNSAAALQKARELLQQSGDSDEAKYVLFVSDGYPTLPTGDETKDENAAFAKAQDLWADDVAILTLHIINVNDTDVQTRLMKFMQRISGYPENPSDVNEYFNADNDQRFTEIFGNLGDAIGCPLPPLNPPPADPTKIHVFVKAGGSEVPVGNAGLAKPNPAKTPGDITDKNGPFYDGNWFFYRDKNHSIYLSKPVCNMVIDDQDAVVIRSGSPHLTE
jgi:Flp pilus assembly protein TadG